MTHPSLARQASIFVTVNKRSPAPIQETGLRAKRRAGSIVVASVSMNVLLP